MTDEYVGSSRVLLQRNKRIQYGETSRNQGDSTLKEHLHPNGRLTLAFLPRETRFAFQMLSLLLHE
jgi:hypothetical protein